MDDDIERRTADATARIKEQAVALSVDLIFESERAAVILGAAALDASLEKLLQRVLDQHPGGTDNLFGPDRPCGTFSAKIALAYRLGLITLDVEHALQMVRKTRNSFAHSMDKASLTEPPHSDRVMELDRSMQRSDLYKDIVRNVLDAVDQSPETDIDQTSIWWAATMIDLMVSLEVGAYLNSQVEVRHTCDIELH